MAHKQKLAALAAQRVQPVARRETVDQVDILKEIQQGGKTAKKQTSKSVKKFASYLRPESLKALKRIALETDRNDYEVLQEAVDTYLQAREPKN